MPQVIQAAYCGAVTLTTETITADRLEELLADDSIGTVHRMLWLLLWEAELRVLDLLSLDVGDVRPDERKVIIPAGTAGGGTGTEFEVTERAARLLGGLIGDRKSGPLFAVGDRVLTWDEAVRVAQDHGYEIHAFRTGGKRHRQEAQ